MKLRLSKAVRLVLAAFVGALASLLVFGVSVAAAGPYYFHHRPPVTVGNPSVTVVAMAFALVLGIELALIIFLVLPRKRRAGSVRIESRHAEHEPEQTRKAA
jgi:hypothetical protein